MAATGSLLPAKIDLNAVSGGDFSATIVLYTDVAQTTPFDLTGYTVTLIIGGGLLTLASGSGLTITAASGQIVAAITAAQTLTLADRQHYALKLVDGSAVISWPLDGTIFLATP